MQAQAIKKTATQKQVFYTPVISWRIFTKKLRIKRVAVANTEIVIEASTAFGYANSRIPFDDTTLSLWTVTDITASSVITPTSITLNSDKQLVFTLPATTAGNEYSIELTVNGYYAETLTGTFVA